MSNILFDPQTSGGLLISVEPEETEELLQLLREGGNRAAAVVGEVVDADSGSITVV